MSLTTIREALSGARARPHPRREHRAAAVLLPLLTRDDDLHVLFIVRQEHLANHPGQIAFPG
ncbi:MAG: CoA pyrophosphatase, partial [Myxococcales bacterium]|nr:CoA pyrophosphatase [Myxococcales bacterium]